MLNKRRIQYIILFLILAGLIGAGFYIYKISRLAAVVNGEPIYKVEIRAQIEMLAKKEPGRFSENTGLREEDRVKRVILNELITIKLTGQGARKMGVKVSQAELAKKLGQIKKVYGGGKKFDKTLADQGINLSILRDRLWNQLAAEKVRRRFRSSIKISDADVLAYFQQNQAEFKDRSLDESKKKIVKTLKEIKTAEKFNDWVNYLYKKGSIVLYS